jgi:hypothetical protein
VLLNRAQKADDLQQFIMVCRDMAPALNPRQYQYFQTAGLEATSALMALSRDFQEFSGYFTRVTAQLEWLSWSYKDLFGQIQNASELDRILGFLETLADHPLVVKSIRYVQVHHPMIRLVPFGEIKDALAKQDWTRNVDYEATVDGLAKEFVRGVAHHELGNPWRESLGGNIRWPFWRFTDYIPYAGRNDDWTVDDDRTRRYWNWQEGQDREFKRFMAALLPRLCSRFRELDLVDLKTMFSLIPNYLGVEEFTEKVMIPVAWVKGIEFIECYDRYRGEYTEEFEVARPNAFAPHIFTFERPSFQRVIDLLDDDDKIRQAIQAHRGSRN